MYREAKVIGAAVFVLLSLGGAAGAQEYFAISVVDADTGRGIPMVELTTVNEIRRYTDSSGLVAFYEPGFMGQEVFFHVRSHGYVFPADGFGYRGVKLKVTAGGSAELEMRRVNVAERLYRVTGAGVYRDTVLLGRRAPVRRPLTNAGVLGQDTVMACVYRGRIYWFWGDTNRAAYPLGNFSVSGAMSEFPDNGGLDPSAGVNLRYFEDADGFSKKMCPLPGPGPVWIEGLMVCGRGGEERLVAQYSRMKSLAEVAERGLAVFRDERQVFEKLVEFDLAELYPRGQPVRVRVDGADYFYFGHPHPSPFLNVRVPADLENICNPDSYETFTCFAAGSRYDADGAQIMRDEDGRVKYAWRRGAPPIDAHRQAELIARSALAPDEGWLYLRDVMSGERVLIHAGTVCWNEYLGRWLLVGQQVGGSSSYLGEIWYAEADTVLGPWVYATRIVTHDHYTFYNPAQHPFFDQENGRVVYFEGTYTATFSASREKTPRYDYNQIMYRLSLDDPRLFLPRPVYRLVDERGEERLVFREGIAEGRSDNVREVAFYAMPAQRFTSACVPVFAPTSAAQQSADACPLFYAMPGDESGGTALYEYRRGDARRYATLTAPPPGDWTRAASPVCRVWETPTSGFFLDFEGEPNR